MNPQLHSIIAWCRFFVVFSAKSEKSLHWPSVLYICLITASYVAVLYLRLFVDDERSIEEVSNMALIIQLITHIATFCGIIASNLWHSKTVFKFFRKLDLFEKKLTGLGVSVDSNTEKRSFNHSLFLAICFYLYVVSIDFTTDIVIQHNFTVQNWLTFYIPLTLSYFTSFLIFYILYMLSMRYSLLILLLNRLTSYKSMSLAYNVDNIAIVRRFVNAFKNLNTILVLILDQFSLRICMMFTTAFTSGTCNFYMMLKGDFQPMQNLIIINLILIYLVCIALVVLGHYLVTNKIDQIRTDASGLLNLANRSPRLSIEVLECYFLIERDKIKHHVFGMFRIDPSIIIGIGTWMISYVVVMLQFAVPDDLDLLSADERRERARVLYKSKKY